MSRSSCDLNWIDQNLQACTPDDHEHGVSEQRTAATEHARNAHRFWFWPGVPGSVKVANSDGRIVNENLGVSSISNSCFFVMGAYNNNAQL